MAIRRQSARVALSLFALGATSLSCSSGSDSGGVTSPPPLAWTSLIGRSWIKPTATDIFQCTQLQVPADLNIKGFRTTASKGQYRLFLSESATRFIDGNGDFDCNPEEFGTRLIYASGEGTPDISFPQDVGVHVQAGDYLIMNLELFDSTLFADTGSTEVLIQAGSASDVTRTADILLAGSLDILIQPQQTGTANGGCSAPADYQILAAMPLMSPQAASQTLGVNAAVLQNGPFSNGHQEYTLFQPAFSVHQGDSIGVSCTFDNKSSIPLISGDGVLAATCDNVIYRTPVPDPDTYFGCVD